MPWMCGALLSSCCPSAVYLVCGRLTSFISFQLPLRRRHQCQSASKSLVHLPLIAETHALLATMSNAAPSRTLHLDKCGAIDLSTCCLTASIATVSAKFVNATEHDEASSSSFLPRGPKTSLRHRRRPKPGRAHNSHQP